jgi:hypothetical protein
VDAVAAGKYTLAAISGSMTKTVGPITVASGMSVTTNFSFP